MTKCAEPRNDNSSKKKTSVDPLAKKELSATPTKALSGKGGTKKGNIYY